MRTATAGVGNQLAGWATELEPSEEDLALARRSLLDTAAVMFAAHTHSLAPMFGQLGFFNKFAGKDIPDKRPLERYVNESKRLLGVLEQRLDGRQWVMDDEYTIADISMLGWVRNLIGFYGARELVEFYRLAHVPAWLERGLARPAVQRGLEIPKRP